MRDTNDKTGEVSRSLDGLVRRQGCTPMGEYKCQIPMPVRGRTVSIDWCIADIVAALNSANITTVMSCCGHGDESIARIDLEDGRVLKIEGHTPPNSRGSGADRVGSVGE